MRYCTLLTQLFRTQTVTAVAPDPLLPETFAQNRQVLQPDPTGCKPAKSAHGAGFGAPLNTTLLTRELQPPLTYSWRPAVVRCTSAVE
jgi:hypothetical protein